MLLTKTKLLLPCLFAIGLVLCSFQKASSQLSSDSLPDQSTVQRFAASVAAKSQQLEEKLVAKSMKVLTDLQQQEEKLHSKMLKGKDSLIAKIRLAELTAKYSSLKDKLKVPPIPGKLKQYIPRLDSLSTSLRFLSAGGTGGPVSDALSKVTKLQDKFQQAEEIKTFIRERKEMLKQQLEKLGMLKQLKKFNKQAYYYAAQIKDYKEILNDPKKIEKKVLELLSKTKLFKDFMRKNSMLASLFPMPGGSSGSQGAQTGFAGLQTRSQLLLFITNQSPGMSGPGFASSLQKNIASAQGVVDQIRNKLKGLGGNSDLDMPDFKPNNQKTKSFKKRLEIGTNLQSQKSNYFFPTTTDIGISIGYKLNDKSIIGIGTSGKIGWGKNIQYIRLTGEGISLRSFMELKLKGSFYASGGLEYNYQQSFDQVRLLYNPSAWKSSALIGITKTISFKSKFFKKAKVQLLYDFLAREKLPVTQPLKFRIGYVF